MPPQKGQRHIVLKEGERVIVFTEPDSRLSLVLGAINAASAVLIEGIRLSLITSTQALRAFVAIGEGMVFVISPDRKSDS